VDAVGQDLGDPANPRKGQPVQRFASITDCQAEPTGIYFSKSGRTLFVDIQHRGGDGRDGAFGIQKISNIDFTAGAR
jgi:secreted PhoX family phosphatase